MMVNADGWKLRYAQLGASNLQFVEAGVSFAFPEEANCDLNNV